MLKQSLKAFIEILSRLPKSEEKKSADLWLSSSDFEHTVNSMFIAVKFQSIEAFEKTFSLGRNSLEPDDFKKLFRNVDADDDSSLNVFKVAFINNNPGFFEFYLNFNLSQLQVNCQQMTHLPYKVIQKVRTEWIFQ